GSCVAGSSSGCGVWIADEVSVRSGTGTVCHTGVIGKTAVGDAERNPGLDRGDARKLPATQKSVRQAGLTKERKIIDIAEIQRMTLIEVGTCPAAPYVVGVNNTWRIEGATVRGV